MKTLTTIITFLVINTLNAQVIFTDYIREAWEDEFHMTYKKSTVGFEADTMVLMLSIDDISELTGGQYGIIDTWIKKDPVHFTRVFLNKFVTKSKYIKDTLNVKYIRVNFVNRKLEIYDGATIPNRI